MDLSFSSVESYTNAPLKTGKIGSVNNPTLDIASISPESSVQEVRSDTYTPESEDRNALVDLNRNLRLLIQAAPESERILEKRAILAYVRAKLGVNEKDAFSKIMDKAAHYIKTHLVEILLVIVLLLLIFYK